MPVDEEYRPLAQDLNGRIRAHDEWGGVTRGRTPAWFGRMLTCLVLAIAPEEVEYLTTDMRSGNGRHIGRVVVFSASAVVVVDVEASAGDEEATITTTVRSRAGLKRYGLGAAESVFGDAAFSDWPGALTATVAYDDGLELELPLSPATNSRQRDELRALVASLRADFSH